MVAVAPKLLSPTLTEDDPVLRAVLTAPVEPGAPPAEEAEALRQARAGGWVSSGVVSTDIAARARAHAE